MKRKFTFFTLLGKVSLLATVGMFSIGQVSASEENLDGLFRHYSTLNDKSTLVLSSGQQDPQDMRFSITVTRQSLANFITALQKTVGDKAFFNLSLDESLKNIGEITLDAKNTTLREILNSVLPLKGLTYTVKGNVFIIHKKDAPKVSDKMTINGVVSDSDTKKPITGATVLLLGTSTGAISDERGRFNLSVPVGSEIEVSFVGMKNFIKRVGPSDASLVVEMKKDAMAVEDVVVTGYFNKSSNVFTGAVKTIKKEEIQKFGNAGVLNVLAMSDPSFKIRENINAGSDPNALPDFFVRGESSFMGGSNLPTFIVDGYEVSVQYVLDMDIERIESLSILKDASATVFYGSRAANGVVVIETRRPSAGKLLVTYSNKTSLQMPDLSDYRLMNATEKLEYEVRAGLYTSQDPAKQFEFDKAYQNVYKNIVGGVNTDWISQPVRNAVSHNHSLYVSGGNEAVTYALNGSYNKNVGVIKESSKENYSVGFDLTYRIKEKISIKNSMTFSNNRAQNSPYGSFSQYALMNPYERIYDESGKYIQNYRRNDRDVPNPLYNSSLNHRDVNSSSVLINNLSFDYIMGGGFRFIASLALNKSSEDSDYFLSPLDVIFRNKTNFEDRGYATVSTGKGFSYNMNAQLTYNKNIGKHNIYTGIGVNLTDDNSQSKTMSAKGFVDEDFSDIKFALGYDDSRLPATMSSRSRLVGFLGNVNYSYDNRYFVDFSGRIDGSSKYGSNNRYAPLWSVGGGWNLNNEKFMSNVKWIETLKLRGSMGVTGNQNFDPTQAQMSYKYWNNDVYYQSIGVSYIQFGNRDLAWQETLKRNVGLDVLFFQRRLSLTVNYYNDLTSNLVIPITVAPSLGFTSYNENYGSQSNKGVEFDLTASLIRNKNFDFAITASGSHNVNKIEKISSALSALNEKMNSNPANFTKPIAMYAEGESTTTLSAVRSLGINPQTGNELYLDRFGNVTEIWDYRDKVNVGDKSAKLSGSVGINVMYKQLSLSANMFYSVGGVAYNNTLSQRVEGADPVLNADKRVLEERWKQPGDITFYKNIANREESKYTSRFVQKNDYIDMGNLALTYRFTKDFAKKIGMSNLKISLNTNNVFHISSIKRERGIDYPFARQFTFSLNANF